MSDLKSNFNFPEWKMTWDNSWDNTWDNSWNNAMPEVGAKAIETKVVSPLNLEELKEKLIQIRSGRASRPVIARIRKSA